jgi:hypothetical protein
MILSESLLTLRDAARELPGRGGKRVHIATVWRWAKRGVRGHRLETTLVGGTRCTSRQAVQRFLLQLNGGDPQPSGEHTITSKRAGRAEHELKAAGW